MATIHNKKKHKIKKTANVQCFKQEKNCRCYFSYVYLNTTPKPTLPCSKQHHPPTHTPTPHLYSLINWRMRKETHKWRVSEWMNEWESEWESNDYCIGLCFFTYIYSSNILPTHRCFHHRIYATTAKEVKGGGGARFMFKLPNSLRLATNNQNFF